MVRRRVDRSRLRTQCGQHCNAARQALPERQRPLFLGFVLGDTRGQAADVTDDFRGSGLTHLLAVSGENVAFVLALAGPLLRRLSLRPRFVATVTVIAFFALVTRFEPSVLRASVMAALAVTASTLGREASRLRLLALAVALLVVLDPFLVRTVGFQLSVAACAGIVLLAPPLARAMRGPRVLCDALAVTIAAQAGVAPVLVIVFGGVPLASVPANMLAAPVAAAVMVWGVGAGMAAGLLGPRFAALLHWPTNLMIRWIAGVAHWSATLPLGELEVRHLGLIALGVVFAVVGRRAAVRSRCWLGVAVRRWRADRRRLGDAVACAARAPDGPVGSRLGRGVVAGRGRCAAGARRPGADRRRTRRSSPYRCPPARRRGCSYLVAVDRRLDRDPSPVGAVGQVLTPAGSNVAGATVLREPISLRMGGLEVTVTPDDGRLVVDVARGPPV